MMRIAEYKGFIYVALIMWAMGIGPSDIIMGLESWFLKGFGCFLLCVVLGLICLIGGVIGYPIYHLITKLGRS